VTVESCGLLVLGSIILYNNITLLINIKDVKFSRPRPYRHSPVLMTVDCVGASSTSGISFEEPMVLLPIVASNRRLHQAKWFYLFPRQTRCHRIWFVEGNSIFSSTVGFSKP
jgi:hypothetical protein